MASTRPTEIELKLLAPTSSTLRAIARRNCLGPYRFGQSHIQQLRTTYLDTKCRVLTRNGIALRLRRHGTGWEATAKWSGTVRGALHSRPELNFPLATPPRLPFSLPDGALRDALFAFVLDRPLEPLVVTAIRRRTIDVIGERGVLIAELALDSVRHGPTGSHLSEPYFEVEIELRRGDVTDLQAVGALLRAEYLLLETSESKFSRAHHAITGKPIEAAKIAKLDRDDTLQSAARKIVARQLRRLRRGDPLLRSKQWHGPETVHRVRVAVRRLRSAYKLLSDGMPQALRTNSAAELQWLGGMLGRARDIDVQLALLKRLQERGSARATATRYVRRLRHRQTEIRKELLEAISSARFIRLLIELETFAQSSPCGGLRDPQAEQPIVVAGSATLKSAFNAVWKLSRKALEAPSPDAFHKVRIRCKRFRYMLEFLQPVLPERSRGLIALMTELQDLLGDANDELALAASLTTDKTSTGDDIADQLQRSARRRQNLFKRRWRRHKDATRREVHQLLKELAKGPPEHRSA